MSSHVYYINDTLPTKWQSIITNSSFKTAMCPCDKESISSFPWSCNIRSFMIKYSSNPIYTINHQRSCWTYCDSVSLQVDPEFIPNFLEFKSSSESTENYSQYTTLHPSQSIDVKGSEYHCILHNDLIIRMGIVLKNSIPIGSFFEISFIHKLPSKAIQEWIDHYLPLEIKQMLKIDYIEDIHSKWLNTSHIQYLKLAMLYNLI